MISCQTIGVNGRLGNQMFQMAATIGIASKLGYHYSFTTGRLHECFTLEGTKINNSINPLHLYRENKFSYNENTEKLPSNTEIYGYFQTEKYWSHVKKDIVKAFKVRPDITGNVSSSLVEYCKDSIFVHVRRTDYLTSKGYHPTFDQEFYSKPLVKGSNVSIFTDDINWGNELSFFLNEKGHNTKLISNLGLTDIQEFYLMTQCNGAIISNSSFSWWAAYLGPHQRGQKVFAPQNWFGIDGPSDTQDLCPREWRKI